MLSTSSLLPEGRRLTRLAWSEWLALRYAVTLAAAVRNAATRYWFV